MHVKYRTINSLLQRLMCVFFVILHYITVRHFGPLLLTLSYSIIKPTSIETYYQGCKFFCNSRDSGFHEVQIPAFLFIFSPFCRLFAPILIIFQAFHSAFQPFFLQASLHPCIIVHQHVSKSTTVAKINAID